MIRAVCIWLLCCVCNSVSSQDSTILSLGTVLQLVKYNHPIAKQAKLLPLEGEANIRIARGGFDPKLAFSQSKKEYNSSVYYNINETVLKIPTWFGADFGVGMEHTSGTSLNPDDKTPAGGLSFTGITMPVLRNLITDQRRTSLRKAQAMQVGFEQQRNQVLNDLAIEVFGDYINWYAAWQELEQNKIGLALASTRLIAIKEEYLAGSRAGADTVETSIQVQNFNVSLNEAQYKVSKYKLELSAHLWDENLQPVELRESVIPSADGLFFLDSMMQSFPLSSALKQIPEKNPILLELDAGLLSLEYEKRFKKQALLPQLDLKYNILSAGNWDFANSPGQIGQNYTFGATFNTSLILRKERADLALANIKLQSYGFKRQQKEREISQKVKISSAQEKVYSEIYSQYSNIVRDYNKLYELELIRFASGDGTIFLVNTRETKLLEAKQKNISFFQKWKTSQVEYLFFSGVLWQFLDY
jgi:outer membrane protein TolC